MSWFQSFLRNNTVHPVILGLASGLYPLFFYYSNNYALINTWKHLGFFIMLFLVMPIVGFVIFDFLFRRKIKPHWLLKIKTFLNVFGFGSFIVLCLYAGIQWSWILIAFAVAIVMTLFLWKHLKKIVLLQLVLAIINLFWLVPTIFEQINYNDTWTKQPDNIEQVQFVKKPNVYYIQPDGYVNYSELNKGYYQLDTTRFQRFAKEKKFTHYPNIRSNYSSTIISNAATFMMRHHYYNYGFNFTEIANGREIIMNDNPVLQIFKRNGYKTHFLAQQPYLLANRPTVGYDRCNYDVKDIAYINDGFVEKQEVIPSMRQFLDEDPEASKFFFIEIFKPGHIPSHKMEANGLEKDKDIWIDNLKLADTQLEELVNIITEKDPEGLIMIMADHGGYVGWDYILQLRSKTQDRDKLYSAFSTNLLIKWPNNEAPRFDSEFRSGVNVFRILFSYLGEETSFLNHLEDDSSYTIIDDGAPKGIYKVINNEGEVTFEKRNK